MAELYFMSLVSVLVCLFYQIQYSASQTETLPFNFSELFPLNFGESAGDHFGPTGDDSASDVVTLFIPFTFFGNEYTKIIVNSNGVLSFGGEPFLFYQPTQFPFISSPLIALFWHDFYPARGGSISYRQTNDSDQLLLIHRLLYGQTFAEEFYPVLLFVTTWYQVPQYNEEDRKQNSIQVVMATDNTKTIAVFIYGDIQWGDGAQIGFNAGDGHTYFMLDEALSNQTLSMDERSNINQQGVFAFRIDNLRLVECSASLNCLSQDLGTMTIRQCCVGSPAGLAFVHPGSEECHICIVFGWFNDSLIGEEREDPYSLQVGYQKGAQHGREDFTFSISVEPTNSDVMIITGNVRISAETAEPQVVLVMFCDDRVTQEGHDIILLRLNPSTNTSLPTEESVFFENEIKLTIIDNDVLEISLTQDEFQASESDGIMEVTMCRQQQIYSSVTVMISLVTSIDDVMIYEAALRPIPPSVQNSPNRADHNDFSGAVQTLTFHPGSFSCLSRWITIINDDINEADEQFFIIKLSLIRSQDPDMVVLARNVSLGVILDDDPIKIGFEQPSYTFIEPPSVEMFHVSLVKEGGRLSEQTFEVKLQVSDMTIPFLPASPDEEFVLWYFEILPNQNTEENEAFHIQVSSVDFPHFLTSNSSLFTETLIVIKDSQNSVGFIQNVYTIRESDDHINISVFSYIYVSSLDDLIVTFSTFHDTALGGSDYKDISEQISLIGNQSTATISISITNDDLAEGLEMFGGLLEVASQTLNLSSVSTVRIEIIDDEVEGICGNVLPRGNCSVDALCRVSKNGRKLQNCFCRDGFLGNGLMCQDVNECSTGLNWCHAYASCSNVPGSFECNCKAGFFGDGRLCLNDENHVDGPCNENTDNCTCFNSSTSASPQCGCLQGYNVQTVKGANLVCQDIDECALDRSVCNGTCKNTPGSYNCFCPAGFTLNSDGNACVDVDECVLGTHNCDRNAHCFNRAGGFNCTCRETFFGNGFSCSRVDECSSRCQHTCISVGHSAVCGCHPGFYLLPNLLDCADVNECELFSNCNVSARCINTIGSYECECKNGFQGNGFICNDIDECDSGLHNCDENAICNNTFGGFNCTCNKSLYGDGTQCRAGIGPVIATNVNSVTLLTGVRHQLSYTIGQDYCFEDVDTLQHGAQISCSLANTPFPPPQFRMTATRTIRNSGSETLLSSLTSNVLLNNSLLMFLFEEDTIAFNVACTVSNIFGTDTMTTSIRVCGETECQVGVTNNCTQQCTRNIISMGNTSYECSCYEGYAPNEANSHLCDDINECVNSSLHNCTRANSEVCWNTDGSYECECMRGFERDETGQVCTDINECSIVISNTCSENETCLNTLGSFDCFCKPGFSRSALEMPCIDINECANDTLNGCLQHDHQVCANTLGSFSCDCESGFQQHEDGFCQDVNECLSEPTHGCSQICNNTEGSYSCSCDSGYVVDILDAYSCNDIDECIQNSHKCHLNGECVNILGSYECHCRPPFDGDGFNCKFSETVLIGSGLGAVVFLLICVIMATLTCIICYSRHCGKEKLAICHQLNEDENSDTDYQVSTRRISVQSSFKLKLPPPLIIEASSIKVADPIGQGEFGIVYKGQLERTIGYVSRSETVAIKTLKGIYDSNAVKEMLRECSKMYIFEHPNVLSLMGVCLDGGTAPYIIMPFMANGSLLTHLKSNRKSLVICDLDKDDEEVEVTRKKLADMCIQVAKGMKYLASMKVVHRDLAARNCMIDANFVIKVADFGLSENIGTKEYFRQERDTIIKLPLKWLAPECIDDYIFSEKSDVWAYGVTCWEIFSGGKVPYPSADLLELPRQLVNGFRLEQPTNRACNEELYDFTLQCWELEPEMRPTFSSIVDTLSHFLETMVDYMDVSAFTTEMGKWAPDKSLAMDASKRATVFKNDTFIELETIDEN